MAVSWKVVRRNVDHRRRRRQSAAVLLLALPCAGQLAAQRPQRCGWSPWPGESTRPAAVTALLARPTPVAAVKEAGGKLDRWFDGCDEGAAREAALDLRNALEPGSYNLAVSVENRRTGERAVRSTDLLVLERQ